MHKKKQAGINGLEFVMINHSGHPAYDRSKLINAEINTHGYGTGGLLRLNFSYLRLIILNGFLFGIHFEGV